ncbi:hypothetical protein [Holzapfeliella sp. JNUCC 80]
MGEFRQNLKVRLQSNYFIGSQIFVIIIFLINIISGWNQRIPGKSYALFFEGLYGGSGSSLAYLAVFVPTMAVLLSSKDEARLAYTKRRASFLTAGVTGALSYLVPAAVLAIISIIADGNNGVPQTLMVFRQIIEVSPLFYLIINLINLSVFGFVYGCLSFATTKLFNNEAAGFLTALAVYVGGSYFVIFVIGIWELIHYMPVATFASTNIGANLAEFSILLLGACLINYIAFRRQTVKGRV